MSKGEKNSHKEDGPLDNEEMSQLRELVLGKNSQLVRDVVKEEARNLVANVLTEALHDRQKSDGSVTKVLAPLVEESVESSVIARKTQFVGFLYPLVGGLVRKAVSSSLAEIIEQTNELLESSLTYKGLRWRFEARRAGISYSQYVVRQTFEYRVEQVLLIHRETGLLLKTVVSNQTQTTDGDMFSAMLTAINDFVADSFSLEGTEQSLDEIKTDDFTLLIKQGPKAVIVAAITGSPPANIADKLQLTLENIHQIYSTELNDFDGDSSGFENTSQQLNGCLLAQQKEGVVTRKKKPWLAILLLLLGISGFGYFIAKGWYLDHLTGKILSLESAPGIVLLSAVRCENEICLDVLRDPVAQDVISWTVSAGSFQDLIQVNERAYRSLDPMLLSQRLSDIQQDFPELSYNDAESKFSGSISVERYDQLNARLNAMPDNLEVEKVLDSVTILKQEIQSGWLNTILLEQHISDVKTFSLGFDVNSSDLPDPALVTIEKLSVTIAKITDLAHLLKERVLIVIMGASTNSGSDAYNQKLSLKRAEVVKTALLEHGVEPALLKAVGLGGLSSNDDERRVTFEVIRLQHPVIEKEQD